MTPQDADAYATARLRRTLHSVASHGDLATRDELEVLRDCYAHLNRDTPRVCAGRCAPHEGRRRAPRGDA